MVGINEAKIRMLGRWAPDAMIRYVGGSSLAASGEEVVERVEAEACKGPSVAMSRLLVASSKQQLRLATPLQ